MKRFYAICILFALMLTVCGCAKTSVDSAADVKLTYIYGDANVRVTLEDEEAETIRNILNGKKYDPIAAGVPACGFDENISLEVGGRVFAIACDACNCIQDLGNLRFFDVPEEEMEYIRGLFGKYGGGFPCI